MAVADTITSIKGHIQNAYGMAEEKGATIPEKKNLQNLADCVGSISGGGGVVHPKFVSFAFFNGSEIDLSWLRTDNITSMKNMFYLENKNNVTSLDVSKFDTRNVVDMSGMFKFCKNITTLDISNFYFGNVTDCSGMFYISDNSNNSELISITLPTSVDFRKVKYFNNMFYNCSRLNNIYGCQINDWQIDGSIIDNISYMFGNCGFREIRLSNWNLTSNNLSISYLFDNSANAITIEVPKINSTGVKVISSIFDSCLKLKKIIGLENWNIPNVNAMSRIFYRCYELEEIDLSFWNFNLQTTSYAFSYCTKLKKIDIRNMELTNCTLYTNMFGTNNINGVPNNCLIIVKDNANKQWVTSKFSRLTNVKTPDELDVN